jgi:hypothetical protein
MVARMIVGVATQDVEGETSKELSQVPLRVLKAEPDDLR